MPIKQVSTFYGMWTFGDFSFLKSQEIYEPCHKTAESSAIPLWERACSRRRSVSRRICKLTHRFREQARSDRGIWWLLGCKKPP
ncbi:hypothetical protein E1508_02390 [Pseudomonas moraviensis]|nr:hypothetical protein E1508_02390 [Pseudomonas moraviensis]